jgi:hypothetical protein
MNRSNPTEWADASNEHFMVWTSEVQFVSDALRSLASILDNDPDLVLLNFTNTPVEPGEPWNVATVQAFLSKSKAVTS